MCMMYESYEIGCVDYCIAIYVPIVLWRKGPVWHGRSAKTVLYIYIYWEEGTRMARAECEDGAIYISCWEEGTCMAQAECEDGAMIYL